MILMDTSVLLEYFRKQDKTKTLFYSLAAGQDELAVSTITHYEIMIGSNATQDAFWSALFNSLTVLHFDPACSIEAVKIYQALKPVNLLIDLADLTITATALAYNTSLATFNTKHFSRVSNLQLLS